MGKIATADRYIYGKLNQYIDRTSCLGKGGSVVLYADAWENSTQTIEINGLRENDAVLFTPLTVQDKANMDSSNLFTSSNGSLVTFVASSAPTTDISMKYFVVRGA